MRPLEFDSWFLLRCCVPRTDCAVAACPVIHGVNQQLGPVHQPPSSLALDRDPVGPPDGVCGQCGCDPALPRIHRNLAFKRESRAAAVLAVRPGGREPGYVSRWSASVRSLFFVSSLNPTAVTISGIVLYSYTKGIRSKNGGLPLWLTVILLSSSLVGPLLIHVGTLVDRCPWYM